MRMTGLRTALLPRVVGFDFFSTGGLSGMANGYVNGSVRIFTYIDVLAISTVLGLNGFFYDVPLIGRRSAFLPALSASRGFRMAFILTGIRSALRILIFAGLPPRRRLRTKKHFCLICRPRLRPSLLALPTVFSVVIRDSFCWYVAVIAVWCSSQPIFRVI